MDNFGVELLCSVYLHILQVPTGVQDADSVSHGTQEALAQAVHA